MIRARAHDFFIYFFPLMNGFIDDPSDFQSSSFQKIDEQLRCPICKELFNTAMMISTCSHSFCALCVRRCLSEEQVCPKCRKEAFSNSIIHNYDLDNVVNIWRISRYMHIYKQCQPYIHNGGSF